MMTVLFTNNRVLPNGLYNKANASMILGKEWQYPRRLLCYDLPSSCFHAMTGMIDCYVM